MLLSLSKLPIYLLLLHSATSADLDLNNNKSVLRRETNVLRTYKSNHPPIIESDDKIPVTVVYDDEEVIKVINNKNGKKTDIVVEEEKTSLKEAPPANHPPSFSEIVENKENFNLKPRARSIQIPVTKSDEPKAPPTESTTTRKENKKLKRVQRVRRVKTNKKQIDTHSSESENTENKVTQKEVTKTPNKTRVEPSIRAPHTFERRKGTRDPVVPILELESYVFSHSGDFHYSYESGDGTKAYERGELKSSNGGAGSAVEGNFSYKDKDGNDISLSYTADENGYRPIGAHLPTPPPIPPAIARALAYLATKTTPEPITERIKTL